MTEHKLKCHPPHYQAVIDRLKPFELRKNDRGFQSGDIAILEEWDPATYARALWEHQPSLRDGDAISGHAHWQAEQAAYTGRSSRWRITYVLADGPWLTPGYAALGLGEE